MDFERAVEKTRICKKCGSKFDYYAYSWLDLLDKWTYFPEYCGECELKIFEKRRIKKAINETRWYSLGEGVIKPDILLSDREIILPSKEIVSGLQVVNSSLLAKVQSGEIDLHKLTPRQLEEVVCELLDKSGFSVKLTKQTCDGGKDIIVCEQKLTGNFVTYVECKKYRKDRPVSVSLVRELYGVVEADRVTAGMLIATSYFSPQAVEFQEKIKSRMSLMDCNSLFDAISKI